jgi:hypothetical protein
LNKFNGVHAYSESQLKVNALVWNAVGGNETSGILQSMIREPLVTASKSFPNHFLTESEQLQIILGSDPIHPIDDRSTDQSKV